MLIGITGNFVAGKSAFARILGMYRFKTIDADRLAKDLYNDPEIVEKIVAIFGESIAFEGKVDTDLLANIVFNNHEKRKKIEEIIHPLVRKKIEDFRLEHLSKEPEKIVFVEVPLLFEAKMENLFDAIILVTSDTKTAMQRAINKGFTEGEFKRRREAQIPAEKLISKADFVIDTEGEIHQLRGKVGKLITEIEALAKKKGVGN